MLVSGFNLPVFALIASALFYTLLLAFSTAIFFWLPHSQAETIGPLLLVAASIAVARALRRRLRQRIGGRLDGYTARDIPRIGSKAGYLAVLSRTGVSIPPGFVLPRRSFWLLGRLPFRWLLWPRLRRALGEGALILRPSVPAEDAPGSGQAGRYTSRRCSGASPEGIRTTLREMAESLDANGEHSLLVQAVAPGRLTLVSSFDPISGREDLVRLETYQRMDDRCDVRRLARWSIVERAARGGVATLEGTLLRAERAAGGPVLLETLDGPTLVQVRLLQPPPEPTWALSAYLQGGGEKVPESLTTAALRAATAEVLPSGGIHARVHGGRLYFQVRDQLTLYVENSAPRLLLRFAVAEARARARAAASDAHAVLHLICARALIDLLAQFGRLLEPDGARIYAAFGGLALADAGFAPLAPLGSPAAGVRWARGLLPWRRALAGAVAVVLRRRVDAYLRTRARLPPLRASAGAPAEALHFDGEWATPLEAGELATVPIYPGEARGPLRKVTEPQDLETVVAGDILWSPASAAWLSGALGRAAAVLTARGGGLTHLALNCAARGVPYAAGVDLSHLETSQLVRVVIDARGASVDV